MQQQANIKVSNSGKIATDTHEVVTTIYANKPHFISMFSYDLKDSERDIRMLKMIHGMAIKC